MSCNFHRESSAAFDYTTQWGQNMQSSDYIVPDPNSRPGLYIAEGDAAGNLTNSVIRQSVPRFDNNSLDYVDVCWPSSLIEESYTMDEIAAWDRLLYQQRELDLMKLSRQLNQLRHTEKYLAITKQVIRNQQLLSKFPNQEDRLQSARMNQWQIGGNGFTTKMLEEWKEIDSWEQGSPMALQSEKGSVSNCAAQSDSGSDQQQEPRMKARHCRHFLKGFCDRGASCGFRHDYSIFCTDLQKVFLGGLPKHVNSSLLRQKLKEQGYTVLNNPRIHKWYSPQVCLGSIAEAKRLVEKGSIVIDGAIVRVRPYEAVRGDREKKFPDEVRRSIFLSGLAPNTTAEMIRNQLAKIGLVVVNTPLVESGYSRKVVLETFEQTLTLLRLSCVEINGSMASVRPFANIRRSSGKKARRNKGSINQSK